MKLKLIALLTLFSATAQAALLPPIPMITIGGMQFTKLNTLIHLYGHVVDSTNRYSSFRKSGASAGYAPSGVAFRIKMIKLMNYSTNTQNATAIFYANNDLGINSTTAPVSQVNFGNDALVSQIQPETVTRGAVTYILVDFLIPSGKYVGIDNNAQVNEVQVELFGYEE